MKGPRLWIVCATLFALADCTATTNTGPIAPSQQSQSVAPAHSSSQQPVLVAKLPYLEAIQIAYEVAAQTYNSAQVNETGSSVFVRHWNVWVGDVSAHIKPILVQDKETGEHGFIFEFVGNDTRRVRIARFPTAAFFARLNTKIGWSEIETLRTSNYRILEAKGIAERIDPSVPITVEAFRSYLTKKARLSPYEGIWHDDQDKYVLGLIRDQADPNFRYKAFVLESTNAIWKPGDVKFKFRGFSASGVALSRAWSGWKVEYPVTFEASRDAMVTVNAPFDRQFALIRVYPSADDTGRKRGSGTAWLVSSNGHFVTNAHVVEDADEIMVGFQDALGMPARVVAMDKVNDLAIVEVSDTSNLGPPLPIYDGNAGNGTRITVIGYPLAAVLGDDPRVTDGLVNAQSGIDRDVSRYQISAAIQPGSSGSPVITEDGMVIGVVASTIRGGMVESTNFAVKSGRLLKLLGRFKIPYTSKSTRRELDAQSIFKIYRDSVLPIYVEVN